VSGLAHKHTGGRTFLVRQWRRVRVDNATALMQRDELDVAQGAVEELPGRFRVLRRFNPTGGSLCKENACPAVHHVPHVITNIILRPIVIKTATVPSMVPIHDQHLSALFMTRILTPGSSTSRKTWPQRSRHVVCTYETAAEVRASPSTHAPSAVSSPMVSYLVSSYTKP
jgi:hypothetical protein